MEKLTLENVEVVFANLVDEGFGKSLTINCTDEKVKDKITKWVKENKIGKGDKAGTPNFKEYEGKLQYAFKINDYTQFGGLHGLTKDNLGFGATVSLSAKAFDYDNKFGKGTSGALTAVVVIGRAKTGADGDLAELLGSEANKPEEKSKDVVLDADEVTEEIPLSEIPF